MLTTDYFAKVPTADFVGIILDGGKRADEAMYYLLQHILHQPLRRRYELFQHHLLDSFDDVLDDFFLYLRDGKDEDGEIDGDGGNGGCEKKAEPPRQDRFPYPSLRRIRNREAFVQWMLRTFRNYLSVRATKEGPLVGAGLNADSLSDDGSGNFSDNSSRYFSENISENISDNFSNSSSSDIADNLSKNSSNFFSVPDAPSSILTDERKLSTAASVLAYAHQKLPPRDGLILLRTLLTMLNKRQSLPNEEMAEALEMTDTSYRVAVHRVKDRLAQFRTRLLKGESPHLDDLHRQMAQRINEDFLHLYPTLLYYYTQSIDTLDPDHADAVNRLRQAHLTTTGNLLHEPTISYEVRYSKTVLWNLLERLVDG